MLSEQRTGKSRIHHVETTILPVVIGALGTVPRRLIGSIEILGISNIIASTQTTALRRQHSDDSTQTTALRRQHSDDSTQTTALRRQHSDDSTQTTALRRQHSDDSTQTTALRRQHSDDSTLRYSRNSTQGGEPLNYKT